MPPFKLTLTENRKRAAEIFERLRKMYPDAKCSLDHKTPLDLIVATTLSAQCTDARVNIVTKDLFKKYKRPEDYINAGVKVLEKEIQSTGFYRNKAKNIVNMCKKLVENFGGKVPNTLEELVTLDGVGRKTANVVLGTAFGVPGVVVDTHCGRIARRLGFTKNTDPVKVEQDLMKVWNKPDWSLYSHMMVFHGRALCLARGPKCSICPLADLCPFPTSREGKKIAR